MTVIKKAGIILAIALVAAALVFVLMAHGDEQVSGVALADRQITDSKVLDTILSSKGATAGGFDGTLYATATMEYGKYKMTALADLPAGKQLCANVLFNSSPKGTRYRAVWSQGGSAIHEETQEITAATNVQALPFLLDASQTQPGDVSLTVYYADKAIFTQTFRIR